MQTDSARLRPRDEAWRGPLFGKENDGAFAVGEVGVARQIVSRRCAVALADAVDVAGGVDPSRLQQVLDHVVAGFVDVGIDAVSRQVPRLGRKADADIAADLADPHALAIEPQWREPESQVETLVDRSPARCSARSWLRPNK